MLAVCQKHVEATRFEEEIQLVKDEMKNYLINYKDIVIPQLRDKLQQLYVSSDRWYTTNLLL